jgi:alkanesulfonate monooxygenase SsuD/methylene tetrahydromethanopterin reductase-like flavin-dependent oxidoreductase (luciferase family)
VWEAAYGVDAWVLLAAMATRTERIQLGTMLTPLPWRRPWKVASQVATLDNISGGRAILSVGLGAIDTELGRTGEVTERKDRAEMLDDGIDLIRGLWQGNLAFSGRHFEMELSARQDLPAVVPPVRERIPIWVVGAWPRPKSMRRVLRCDGILPVVMREGQFSETKPEDIRAMLAWMRKRGGAGPGFDVVMEGETPADDPAKTAEIVQPWLDAGCTWWIEARWQMPNESGDRMREVRERLEAGPPRL